MKRIMDAPIFNADELYREPKNSGMVALFKWCVIMRVRRPRITHGISEPMKALPKPTHVAAVPNLQPNCPAYPTKITAEKYEVP